MHSFSSLIQKKKSIASRIKKSPLRRGQRLGREKRHVMSPMDGYIASRNSATIPWCWGFILVPPEMLGIYFGLSPQGAWRPSTFVKPMIPWQIGHFNRVKLPIKITPYCHDGGTEIADVLNAKKKKQSPCASKILKNITSNLKKKPLSMTTKAYRPTSPHRKASTVKVNDNP